MGLGRAEGYCTMNGYLHVVLREWEILVQVVRAGEREDEGKQGYMCVQTCTHKYACTHTHACHLKHACVHASTCKHT